MKNKILSKIWMGFAFVIIITAIISSLFRALTPWARQYKPQIEKRLSLLVGHQVTIGSMETAWHLFEPRIRLKNIHLKQTQSDAPSVGDIQVGINLFRSLWDWQIQPGRLYLDNVHLSLTQKEGHWHIDGLKLKGSDENMSQDSQKMLGLWLALHKKIIIRDLSASLHFENGTLIPVSELDLIIDNHEGHYLLRGRARLEQMEKTNINILADLNYNPYQSRHTTGDIYFSTYHFIPAQWQAFLPEKYHRFISGYGNAEFWLNISNGKLQQLQSKISLKRLGIQTLKDKGVELLQRFDVNLLYKRTLSGWEVIADQIKIRLAGVNWPENKLKISHQDDKNQYNIYVKNILLDSFISEAEKWHLPLEKINRHKIHGFLSGTRLQLTDNKLTSFSTAFKRLGWKGEEGIPSANHLAGTISWDEHQGQLQMNSRNSLLAVDGFPAQTFSRMVVDINWNYIRNKWRLHVNRFFLKQPDLVFTMRGMADDPLIAGKQEVNFKAAFAAKHVEHALSFLSKKQLKPSLVDWLQKDIKTISSLDGKVHLRGNMADFPFEKSAGEFKIVADINDAQVRINSQWPYAKKVDAKLLLDKRRLDIDIIRADLQSVPVESVNLLIDDIGHDKEVLLARAKINAPASKMMAVVHASPLHNKLSAIENFKLTGLLGLDLSLQVPLYQHDLPTLVRGQLDFKENTLAIDHPIGKINLSDLNGQLFFNEHGISKSRFDARAFGYPFKMSIHSEKKPEPYTAVDIQSYIDIEDLKKQYPLAALRFMKGQFAATTNIKLTDNPDDMDSIHIQSKLKGLEINLPQPIGKKIDQARNLWVDVDFNSQKALHVKVNYNESISSNLWFDFNRSQLEFNTGEIRFGSARAEKPAQAGLHILGTIKHLNLDEWLASIKQIAGNNESPLLAELRFIDIKFNKLILYRQVFNDFYFKATQKKDSLWSIFLKQGKLNANLIFDRKKFSLKGKIKNFKLSPSTAKKQDSSLSELKPEQLPALNLNFQQFYYDKYRLGDLLLVGKPSSHQYELSHLQLKNNGYQLDVVGNWKQGDKGGKTFIKSDLRIVDLADALKQFNIDPVVEARQGRVRFDGGWKGSFFDYSIKNIFGQLSIVLRNGRITHLSQETEEKMALGKLLSILSLQTIPRRLVLDFSDLSQKGYSFDQFNGNFNFKKGLLLTKNSTIDGPVAYGSMSGSLDLLEKRYDIELKISPHITASLPIVATIAGGPVAGVATWIASKIINRGMHKINAYTYKVTGPWDSPEVQQLKIIHQKKN